MGTRGPERGGQAPHLYLSVSGKRARLLIDLAILYKPETLNFGALAQKIPFLEMQQPLAKRYFLYLDLQTMKLKHLFPIPFCAWFSDG